LLKSRPEKKKFEIKGKKKKNQHTSKMSGTAFSLKDKTIVAKKGYYAVDVKAGLFNCL